MIVQKSPFVIPKSSVAMGVPQVDNVAWGIINRAGGKLGTIRVMPKKSTNVIANIVLDIFSPVPASFLSALRRFIEFFGFFACMIRHEGFLPTQVKIDLQNVYHRKPEFPFLAEALAFRSILQNGNFRFLPLFYTVRRGWAV